MAAAAAHIVMLLSVLSEIITKWHTMDIARIEEQLNDLLDMVSTNYCHIHVGIILVDKNKQTWAQISA